MDEGDATQATQPTQEATQFDEDRPKHFSSLGPLGPAERADIVCVLCATSPRATEAVRKTVQIAPQHILQQHASDPDATKDIALRISVKTKKPTEGWWFGRSIDNADVQLTENPNHRLISQRHFRIFVNEYGSLMIEDASANGTYVDDMPVKVKPKDKAVKSATTVLRHGSVIQLWTGREKTEPVNLMVRIPSREDCAKLYEQNLRQYLEAMNIKPRFGELEQNQLGNKWHGGDKYHFVGYCGAGAFAKVYKVQTRRGGDPFAAKEIDETRFLRNGMMDVKFDQEIRIMKDLQHPNIVKFMESVRYQSFTYLVMEYMPFGELAAELRHHPNRRLPEPDGQQIAKQIFRALDYIHRRGIAHRDIKPENILIGSRNPLHVKLSDFGLSKAVDHETFLRTFCGTLLYCAPEVYPEYDQFAIRPLRRRKRGDQGLTRWYNPSADSWSFACVLFYVLAGRPPVAGVEGEGGSAQMLRHIMTTPINFEPLSAAGASQYAVQFLRSLLQTDPRVRPSDGECLRHPWLKDIPEHIEYTDADCGDVPIPGELEAIVEEDESEGDDKLVNNLSRLTDGDDLLDAFPVPQRLAKKPRVDTEAEESIVVDEIQYPVLPDVSGIEPASPSSSKPAQRLFGEVTPSLLKSSGVFGMTPTPNVSPALPQGDVLQIEASTVSTSTPNQFPSNTVSFTTTEFSNSVRNPATVEAGGQTTSLQGAEARIEGLHIRAPFADANTTSLPPTESPAVSDARQIILPQALTDATQIHATVDQLPEEADISRWTGLSVLHDDVALTTHQQQLQDNQTQLVDGGLAVAQTFDTIPKTINGNLAVARKTNSFAGPTVTSAFRANKAFESMSVFGKLVPVPGSFDMKTILLEERCTLWGRAPLCDIQYNDTQDTRVPIFGLKIIFHPSDQMNADLQPKDWTQIPGIRTSVATSATRGISINGCRLHAKTPDGQNACYGRIYSGDIITIYDSTENSSVKEPSFLKYEVEILFGDSARKRPENEKPFVTKCVKYNKGVEG